VARFETQVEEDIRKGPFSHISTPDLLEIHQRYLHALRQTLEEVKTNKVPRHIRNSGKDREEKAEHRSFGEVQASSSSEQVSPTVGHDSQLPLHQSPMGQELYFQSDQSFENCGERFHRIDSSCPSRPSDPSMSAPNGGLFDPTNELLDLSIPDSTYDPEIWSASQQTPYFNNFLENELDIDAINTLGGLAWPLQEARPDTAFECEPIPNQIGDNYLMGDDLMAIADNLQQENEMHAATAPWKDKNSGNRFLRQP
jgi:hypothetical protein